ncbi:MAG: FG-GAP-like repeat-containing protein [Bacteroidetes bacterium]|nr:FG-GAP-like repeat-containing protein [Bacteroidota bacterium]
MKKIVLLLLIFISNLFTVFSQTPQINWWFNTRDASFGQSAAGDIDKDGKLEIVFGCYRNDSCVYALNAENGTLLWKYNTHTTYAEGCNDAAPLIADVDGDDSLEVVVAGSCNPKTFCFRGSNGSIKWQTPTAGSDSPPVIADIDNDGKLEILQGGFDGHVMCFNAQTGAVKWSLVVDSNSWVQTAPTILDLDIDGLLDFVVATEKSDSNRVYAYRGSNHTLMWKYTMNDWVYHGTAVADLDGDGKPELVIGDYSGRLVALNGENGSLAWDYVWSASAGYYIGSPVTIADINNDGLCEIIFCNWFKIIALKNNGSLLWSYSIPAYETAFRGIIAADVNNDNTKDVIFGTSNGLVIALKGNTGDTLWTVNLAAHYGNTFEIDNAPLLSDFDHDGKLDLFIIGGHAEYPNFGNDYGRAYSLKLGVANGPDWLMFQHDIRRQSSLCYSVSAITENNVKDLNIYPNPVGDIFIIESVLQGQIELFNLQGQILKSIMHENFTTNIDISTLPAGIYILKLINKNEVVTKKIIKN